MSTGFSIKPGITLLFDSVTPREAFETVIHTKLNSIKRNFADPQDLTLGRENHSTPQASRGQVFFPQGVSAVSSISNTLNSTVKNLRDIAVTDHSITTHPHMSPGLSVGSNTHTLQGGPGDLTQFPPYQQALPPPLPLPGGPSGLQPMPPPAYAAPPAPAGPDQQVPPAGASGALPLTHNAPSSQLHWARRGDAWQQQYSDASPTLAQPGAQSQPQQTTPGQPRAPQDPSRQQGVHFASDTPSRQPPPPSHSGTSYSAAAPSVAQPGTTNQNTYSYSSAAPGVAPPGTTNQNTYYQSDALYYQHHYTNWILNANKSYDNTQHILATTLEDLCHSLRVVEKESREVAETGNADRIDEFIKQSLALFHEDLVVAKRNRSISLDQWESFKNKYSEISTNM